MQRLGCLGTSGEKHWKSSMFYLRVSSFLHSLELFLPICIFSDSIILLETECTCPFGSQGQTEWVDYLEVYNLVDKLRKKQQSELYICRNAMMTSIIH